MQKKRELLGPIGFYEDNGEKAVLLVHGLTGTPTEMKFIAKVLSQSGFSVMCPQLAGHCGGVGDLKKTSWEDWYKTVEDSFDLLKTRHRQVYVCGLSMGALIALILAKNKGHAVSGLGLLSTTFFYDGWNMPRVKRRFLLPLVLHTPLRFFFSWEETEPYGIKCERTRSLVAAILENKAATAAEDIGTFSTPAVIIRESKRLISRARKILQEVYTPMLVVHSLEDDMASIKNAYYLIRRTSSRRVETCFLTDTYHVLPLDKRKGDVSAALVSFFNGCNQKRVLVS